MKSRILALLVLCLMCHSAARAQFLIEMIDTTDARGKGLYLTYKKHDHLGITGYMQPQYQFGQEKGQKSYNGGDFAARANNRFMLRRGRVRFEYDHFTDAGLPVSQVVFQFDGTERGVVIRDFYGRFFENKFQMFSATTGMFARPFGYEVNLSSMNRESPERGRMSQILMKTERDLGGMVSLETRKKNHPLRFLKVDAGVFNGQGLAAPGEFDSYKDFISRVALKAYPLSSHVTLSAGLSLLRGGVAQNNKYVYTQPGLKSAPFVIDSSEANVGAKLPRKYNGADAQLKFKNDWGVTEFRAEYWWGTQPGTKSSSETPAELLGASQPYFIRPFNGAFFYYLQNIINKKHQLGLKYDWYDPNTKLSKEQIGTTSTLQSVGDIKFSTMSFGYNYYMTENTKIMFWYDVIRNEHTSVAGYETDLRDNVFTCRVQFKF